MRQFWQADAPYWTRIPRADYLTAVADAPIPASQSERLREATIKAHAKLKKDELATKVGDTFAGVGYLPDLLVTPVSVGRFQLTVLGAAAVATE